MKQICFTFVTALVFMACSKDSQTLQNEEQFDKELSMVARSFNQGGRPLSTVLSGVQETPNPGDPNGTGTFRMTLNQGKGTISYELSVSNIDLATAAHIHEAPFGVAGPVRIGLTPPDANGFSSGTISVSQELIKEIRQNPSHYYVNVHNPAFPSGAVRGQLSK